MSTLHFVPRSEPLTTKPVVVPQRRQLDTDELFVPGERELILIHDGVEYRLRITQQGKLLLTK